MKDIELIILGILMLILGTITNIWSTIFSTKLMEFFALSFALSGAFLLTICLDNKLDEFKESKIK
jgi:hypothetical protein